jgi:hypothetical protein
MIKIHRLDEVFFNRDNKQVEEEPTTVNNKQLNKKDLQNRMLENDLTIDYDSFITDEILFLFGKSQVRM